METTTILLPVYKRFQLTRESIKSIYENTNEEFELIVWNNDPVQRDLSEWLINTAASRENLWLIESSKNIGPPSTYRYLMEMAKGDYLCILNNDNKVLPGWLKKLKKRMRELPKKCILRPTLIDSDHVVINMGVEVLPLTEKTRLKRNRYQGEQYNEELPNIIEVDLLGAAGTFMHSDVIHDARYSDDVFMGNQDYYFCLELEKEGYKFFVTSDTALVHTEIYRKHQYMDYEDERWAEEQISQGIRNFFEESGWLALKDYVKLCLFEEKREELEVELKKVLEIADNHEHASEIRERAVKGYQMLFPDNADDYIKKQIKASEEAGDGFKLTGWRLLARHYLKRGDEKKALKGFEKALEIESDTPSALGDWYHLARLGDGKRRQQAREILREQKPELLERLEE